MSPKPGQPGEFNIYLLLIFAAILGLSVVFVVSWQPRQRNGQMFQTVEDQGKGVGLVATMLPVATPPARELSSKTAWVATGALPVQILPGKGHPALAEVLRGQEVRIIRESDDGEWSLLDQPVAGWVQTEHLRYTEKYVSFRLTPASFRTYRWVKADPRLRVRSSPDIDSDIVTHVAHGELVEIDQLTEDMRWAHIVAPVEGWTSIRYLSLTPIEK